MEKSNCSLINGLWISEADQKSRLTSTDLIQPLVKPLRYFVTNTKKEESVYNNLPNGIKYPSERQILIPQYDPNKVWEIYRKYTDFTKASIQPARNNLYIRPYYCESDYLEVARQIHGSDYLKNTRNLKKEVQDELNEMRKNWADFYGNDQNWTNFSLFPKFTDEERTEMMFLVGQSFKAKVIQWYRQNSRHLSFPK